ncbi:MAG TPA: hypothetical protein VFI68_08020 [Anaerolineales bacterium]|nr:hypothetical protein [Anaerolineales bacterium]
MTLSKLLKTGFVILLGIYLFSSFALVYIFTREDRIAHAIISMGSGLIVFWVILGGSCMFLFREKVKQIIQRIPVNWQLKFVLFGILMAVLEEAITTTMTNLAPFFGAQIGEAYITASTNYFDVILHHSVIVFIPWFIAWAWILKRHDFSPFCVFLLFGINGLFAESLTFGWGHLNEFAMWIFVYGLMVYLPAYTLPSERGAQPPRIWHGALAFILPLLIGIPWAILINLIFPDHPAIHFPSI